MLKKTKIVATVGPSSERKDVLVKLVEMGVDVFRLNFAHGDVKYFEDLVKRIREIGEELDKYIPIIGDLEGPTVRIGRIKKDLLVENQILKIINADKAKEKGVIPIPVEEFYKILEKGDDLLLDDGKVEIKIIETTTEEKIGKVVRGGEVRSNITATTRNKDPKLPTLTEKDMKFIKFSIENDLEYLALSFVRSREDVQNLKNVLREYGKKDTEVISKIETRRAIENLEEVIKESDAIIIARGDLGMYFNLSYIPVIQKEIAQECLKHGKPSILATQILESMIKNPIPTRSEISDIYYGVQEGVDAMMLSGETAIGAHPIEAVKWLRMAITEAEKHITPPRITEKVESIYDKFALGTILLAESLNAKILAFTKQGMTAKRLSRFRPRNQVHVITDKDKVARKINLLWGINPYKVDGEKIEKALEQGKRMLINKKLLKEGDILVKTSGMRHRATDRLEIETL